MKRTLVLLPLLFTLSGCGYNRIQALDERAEQARSNIGVQLQNRNQLIPNLVATVKGAGVSFTAGVAALPFSTATPATPRQGSASAVWTPPSPTPSRASRVYWPQISAGAPPPLTRGRPMAP